MGAENENDYNADKSTEISDEELGGVAGGRNVVRIVPGRGKTKDPIFPPSGGKIKRNG